MEKRFKSYKFFAHLFSYPEGGQFFKTLEKFYPYENRKPLEELKSLPLEELQAEYISLFVANIGGVPCKPYQSFFSAERTLMGAPAFETARFYDIFGVTQPENDLPDKASFQLDFAAFLIKLLSESKHPEERKRLEALFKAFFRKHILWMEKFADCVKGNTQFEPLKFFAEAFKNFLGEERERLRL